MRPDRAKMLAEMKARRPTKRAIQANLAAFAPDGWTAPVREKKRRKLVDDAIPDMARDLPDERD